MKTKLMAALAALSLAAGATPALAGGYWDGGNPAMYGGGYGGGGSGGYDSDDYCPPPAPPPCNCPGRYSYQRSYAPAYSEAPYEDMDYAPSDYDQDYGVGAYPPSYDYDYGSRGFVGFAPSFNIGLDFRDRERRRGFFDERQRFNDHQRFNEHQRFQQHVFVRQHFQAHQNFMQPHMQMHQMHQMHMNGHMMGGHGHW